MALASTESDSKQMDLSDLKNRFTYHPPVGDQVERYHVIRGKALEFAVLLDNLTPDSREKSLAITHLEEAVFWANAAIARHENGNLL